MNINTTLEGTVLNVAIVGRLDTTTAPQVEEALSGKLDDITELVLDCADLEYISSAGLRVFLGLHKHMTGKGTMKVTHVNDTVMEIFEVTGFDGILTIER